MYVLEEEREKAMSRNMLKNLFSRILNTQIHVISTNNNMIKPALPTHSSLKHYNLSPNDQFTPKNYMPIIFYYPNLTFSSIGEKATINRLKHSLSETLVHYYPFAGRLNSETYVDCNDAGVEFQEVDIKLQVSELLQGSDHEDESLFPDGRIWGNVNENSPLLVVRLAKYTCGGISLAVCLSHKLGDGKSFHTFMTSWAAKMRDINSSISPYFISAANDNVAVQEVEFSEKDLSTKDGKRRFLFPNSELTKLKEIVARRSGLESITRFEVLSALIFKCATNAATANSRFFTPSVLTLAVNMRHKMLPPLPETSIGNIYSVINIEIKNENENNLSTLVARMKKAKMGITGGMDAINIAQNNYDSITGTSLCNMQFYRVDFGWGNPIRVAIPDTMRKNIFMLMDTPNENGIEALVCLNEEKMTFFQQDKGIIEFSSSFQGLL